MEIRSPMSNSYSVQMLALSVVRAPTIPRRHSTKQKAAVARSLMDHGQVRPILVTPDYEIIDGELVCDALRAQGAAEVSAIVLYDQSPDQLRALRLKLHRSCQGAYWDAGALGSSLQHLKAAGVDLQMAGFDGAFLEKLIAKTLVIDIRTLKKPDVALGQTWECNSHSIGCGRSDDQDLINKMLRGRTPDVCAITLNNDSVHDAAASGLCGPLSFPSALQIRLRMERIRQISADDAIIFVGLHWSQMEISLETASSLRMPLLDTCIRTGRSAGGSGLFRNTQMPVLVLGNTMAAKNRSLPKTRLTNVWSRVGRTPAAHCSVGLTPAILNHIAKPGAVLLDTNLGAGTSLFAADACARTCVGIESSPATLRDLLSHWDAQAKTPARKIGPPAQDAAIEETDQ